MPEPAPATFDAQAAAYDARTGLPPGVGEAVASAIIDLGAVAPGDLVLELGAGTGEIGVALARLPIRYLGLDAAPAMLAEFRAKAAPATPDLLVADANAPWPLPDAVAQVIVAARVIHLLQPDHAAAEALRVGCPGGFLMLGRVQRDPESFRERLRRRRQQALRDAGLRPRAGEADAREVIARCVAAGGEALGSRAVAAWTSATSAAAILAEWETLDRMGGHTLDAATRGSLLAPVRAWAAVEFGDLDRLEPVRETFTLDVVRLPGAAHTTRT